MQLDRLLKSVQTYASAAYTFVCVCLSMSVEVVVYQTHTNV